MEQIYTPKQNYKVLVRCFTYNQSKYIEDALNGFAMQKTDFPFICLVMDDCSTDGEQEVIKAWIERECDMEKAEYIEIELSNIILAPHKSNTNCTLAFYFLKQNLYGTGNKKMKMVYPWREHCEYEAICEGDDYWTNPLKLQTQVLFLDKHNSHSMCFHAVDYLYPNGEKKRVERYSEDLEACNMEDVIKFGGNYAKVNTMMIRLSMFKNGYNDWAANCPVGDLPSVLTLFVNGKVAYLKKTMSVYRCDASGSWTKSMDNQMQKIRNHHHKIIDMWMAFDNWTGKQYHREISSKIRTNRWQYYKGVIVMIINKTKNRIHGKK